MTLFASIISSIGSNRISVETSSSLVLSIVPEALSYSSIEAVR